MATEEFQHPTEWDVRIAAVQFAVQFYQGQIRFRRFADDNRVEADLNDWEVIRSFVEGAAEYFRQSFGVRLPDGKSPAPPMPPGCEWFVSKAGNWMLRMTREGHLPQNEYVFDTGIRYEH